MRHIEIHKAVRELLEEKRLHVKHVFYFNYKKNGRKTAPTMEFKKNTSILLPLNNKLFKEKKRIVAEMHGYAYDGIDVGLCVNPEAYITQNIK